MKEYIYRGQGSPRLDQYLQQQLPSLSVGRLHKYLRENKIKLNGKRPLLSARLADRDVIRL